MKHWQHIQTILARELKALLDSPTAYIVIIVFLLLWEFLFFQNAFLVGDASLRGMFDLLPWLLLLFIPAITMGSLAQEKSEGTIEFLLTRPLSDLELIVGKYLAALVYALSAFLFSLPIALCFGIFGSLDFGVVVGQILASLGMASVVIALGIALSSIVRSQIAALLLSAAAAFVLVIIGSEFVTQGAPGSLVPLFDRLSVISHFDSMARGVIDVRDVWYFVSATIIFLSGAYLFLLRRRFGNRKDLYRRTTLGIGIFVAIALISNVIGARIPGRIDLTHDGLYTLSAGTRHTIGSLKDVVHITLYVSADLPSQLQPVLRDIRDTLQDYRVLGNGNIIVAEKDPTTDKAAGAEAQTAGVRAIQFNVIKTGEYQVKTGVLGIVVSSGEKTQALPYVQDTSDLEYQLTSFIHELTNTTKKHIVFLSGNGQKSSADMSKLREQLATQFTVDDAVLDGQTPLPSTTDAVVLAGPTQSLSQAQQQELTDYLKAGGAGLFLLDGTQQNLDQLTAKANSGGSLNLLKDDGVTVGSNVVYDLRSNQTVQMGSQDNMVLLPYPFLPVLQAASTSPIVNRLQNVALPWGSSVTVDQTVLTAAGFTMTPLLKTTDYGGASDAPASIAPQQQFQRSSLGSQVVAVSLVGKSAGAKTPHIVVVGNSQFLSDKYAGNSPTNLAFGVNALSWLTQEESLADIQIKQRTQHPLVFGSQASVEAVRYGNLLLAILLPLAFGAYRFLRRKRLGRYTYQSLSSSVI